MRDTVYFTLPELLLQYKQKERLFSRPFRINEIDIKVSQIISVDGCRTTTEFPFILQFLLFHSEVPSLLQWIDFPW